MPVRTAIIPRGGSSDVMATQIQVSTCRQFGVKADAKEAFALLADVPRSASHYPGVQRFTDLGGGTYRWELEPIGVSSFSHQLVYACRFEVDEAQRTVMWTAVKGVGNTEISGSWRLAPEAGGTRLTLEIRGELTIPVPWVLQAIAGPFVDREFRQQIDTYVANLTRALGGRDS